MLGNIDYLMEKGMKPCYNKRQLPSHIPSLIKKERRFYAKIMIFK
jgi:hypothetical protein